MTPFCHSSGISSFFHININTSSSFRATILLCVFNISACMLSTLGVLPFLNAFILFSISSIVCGLVSMSMSNNSLFGTSTGSSLMYFWIYLFCFSSCMQGFPSRVCEQISNCSRFSGVIVFDILASHFVSNININQS